MMRPFLLFCFLLCCASCICKTYGADDVTGGNEMSSDHVSQELTSSVEQVQDFNISAKAKRVFNEVIETLRGDGEDELVFPERVIWLDGAPGAGKGTNTATIMRILEIPSRPVEVSALLTFPEAQAIKAAGRLVDDATVIRLVFETLLHPENTHGVIIDGFPRTRIQAECLRLLVEELRNSEKNKNCQFIIVNFMVSRETSIERQLARGRDSIEHNRIVESANSGTKVPVRATDLSREAADFRYQTYLDETKECLSILRDFIECDEIDAEGSLDEVRERIYKVFSAN